MKGKHLSDLKSVNSIHWIQNLKYTSCMIKFQFDICLAITRGTYKSCNALHLFAKKILNKLGKDFFKSVLEAEALFVKKRIFFFFLSLFQNAQLV